MHLMSVEVETDALGDRLMNKDGLSACTPAEIPEPVQDLLTGGR